MNNTNDEARRLIEKLYVENYRKMMAIVRRDAVVASMAEDIVQDAFAEALRNADVLLTHENPGGWLMEAVKWKLLNVRRKFAEHSARESLELNVDISGMQAEYGLIELSFLIDQVLTVHEKVLFYLYFICGYSAGELAKEEHVPEGTFKVRMYRMRKKLQKHMKQEQDKSAEEK